jgi:hypothetical protein
MKGRIIHVTGSPADLHSHETDITDGVQVLYDLVIQSQNFGSGFWTIEDLEPVARLAELCDFERSGDVRKYIEDEKHYRELVEWNAKNFATRPVSVITGLGTDLKSLLGGDAESHEHVYSSVGRCMWPLCTHRREG